VAERVAILAPSGDDGPIAQRMLAKWGISASSLADMTELCDAISHGVGAVLLAEEALRSSDRNRLVAVLNAQPTWSDVPLIVLTDEGELGRAVARGVEDVAHRGNVTLLERPVRVATLALALRAALRARRRQYELRDQIIERERLVEAERRARTHAVRLQELTAGLSVASTPADVVEASVEHAARAVGALGVVIAWVNPDEGMVEILGANDMADDARSEWGRFRLDTPVPLADVARSGEAVFLESPAAWEARYPGLAALADAAGHRANAILPLIVEGRPVGALGLAFATPNDFPAEERHLMLSIARQCALALARARLFEAERQARREADEANRAKGQFLAVMSHELRTPLNAIAGYAELIEMGIHGPVTPEQREALRRVMKSEQHLLGLINAVLNYARIETGSVQFDIEDIPVDEVIATCESFVAPQARAKALTLETPEPDPSLVLRADREKAQQILLNLLANAIKFTDPNGRVAVTRKASEGEDAAPTVTIAVSDTGRGIPPDKLGTIFEPFVQVDAALTRTQEGVGLGLAISRELARAMNGDLHASSVVGEGTTLTLTLPRALTAPHQDLAVPAVH
jgi:signal transduction histidine kinase/FixJ family two-component response regulator